MNCKRSAVGAVALGDHLYVCGGFDGISRLMEIIYSIVFKTFKELVYYSKGITDHSLLFYMKMFLQFIHKSRVSDPGLFHLLDPDPGVAKMINFVSIIEDYLEV